MTAVVCLHAWRFEGGNQTYADARAGDPVDGWCVYVRFGAATSDEPFASDVDEDFDTEVAARAFADQLAAEHRCTVQEY